MTGDEEFCHDKLFRSFRRRQIWYRHICPRRQGQTEKQFFLYTNPNPKAGYIGRQPDASDCSPTTHRPAHKTLRRSVCPPDFSQSRERKIKGRHCLPYFYLRTAQVWETKICVPRSFSSCSSRSDIAGAPANASPDPESSPRASFAIAALSAIFLSDWFSTAAIALRLLAGVAPPFRMRATKSVFSLWSNMVFLLRAIVSGQTEASASGDSTNPAAGRPRRVPAMTRPCSASRRRRLLLAPGFDRNNARGMYPTVHGPTPRASTWRFGGKLLTTKCFYVYRLPQTHYYAPRGDRQKRTHNNPRNR